MSAVQSKSLITRVYEQAFNEGNLAVVDELFASGYESHGLPVPIPHGREGVKNGIALLRVAFPDLHYTVEDEIEQGDRFAARWVARATQKGPFMGVPPTGKPVTSHGVFYGRIADGKIAEGWVFADNLSVLQQLGAVPPASQNRLLG